MQINTETKFFKELQAKLPNRGAVDIVLTAIELYDWIITKAQEHKVVTITPVGDPVKLHTDAKPIDWKPVAGPERGLLDNTIDLQKVLERLKKAK